LERILTWHNRREEMNATMLGTGGSRRVRNWTRDEGSLLREGVVENKDWAAGEEVAIYVVGAQGPSCARELNMPSETNKMTYYHRVPALQETVQLQLRPDCLRDSVLRRKLCGGTDL
jgi:hypothetical protein